jgi:hypothetical protein
MAPVSLNPFLSSLAPFVPIASLAPPDPAVAAAPITPLAPLSPILHVDPLSPLAPLTAFNGQAIFDDEHLRLISLVGALGGAVVNLWLFDSPLGVKFMARKVSCSTITGVICTPIAVHWLGIVPNVDNLLAVSFLMAIVSVGLLRSLLPVWTRLVSAKLGVPAPDDDRGENGGGPPTSAPGLGYPSVSGNPSPPGNASAPGSGSATANASVPTRREVSPQSSVRADEDRR